MIPKAGASTSDYSKTQEASQPQTQVLIYSEVDKHPDTYTDAQTCDKHPDIKARALNTQRGAPAPRHASQCAHGDTSGVKAVGCHLTEPISSTALSSLSILPQSRLPCWSLSHQCPRAPAVPGRPGTPCMPCPQAVRRGLGTCGHYFLDLEFKPMHLSVSSAQGAEAALPFLPPLPWGRRVTPPLHQSCQPHGSASLLPPGAHALKLDLEGMTGRRSYF